MLKDKGARVDAIFRLSGLDKLFPRDRIILKEDVIHIKPNPEVYQKTVALLGIDPRDQLVFEDSPIGIEAAYKAGSIVIGMPVVDNPHARSVKR